MEAGDVVYLISGSPPMTVESPKDQYGEVACAWFDERGINKALFKETSLSKEKPKWPHVPR